MFTTLYRSWFLHTSTFLLCMVANGCQKDPVTYSSRKKPDPEESLNQIVLYLERNIAKPYFDTSRGLGKNEISTLISSSTVSHELLKPDENRETYLARITIETSQTYASKQITSKDEEHESGRESKQQELNNAISGGGVEDMLGLSDDPGNMLRMPVSESTKDKSESSDNGTSKMPIIQRNEGTWKDVVELKYEKNQWVLASEIESEWLRDDIERALELSRYGLIR